MAKIHVTSAVVDKDNVTFFTTEANTLTIKQGDPRLAAALKILIPATQRGEVVILDLQDYNIYSEVTKKTNGLVRFFRVARHTVKQWFGIDSVEGFTREPHAIAEEPETNPEAPQKTAAEVAEQIMAAVEKSPPVTSDSLVQPGETIVAVAGNQVITNVEAVKPFLANAIQNDRPQAVQNFFALCGEVVTSRRHSVEDLFKFLSRGDLPLADNGYIIAYKALRRHDAGEFVDAHTKKVIQRPGDYVCVPANLVDLDRHRDCSNGLHIASLSYLPSFVQEAVMLCLIDPRDVMTVPHRDTTKIRVKGYHILGQLSATGAAQVFKGKPFTDQSVDQRLLLGAMQGQHIPVLREVLIQGQNGSSILYTVKTQASLDWQAYLPEANTRELEKAQSIPAAEGQSAPKIAPENIHEEIRSTNPKPVSVPDQKDPEQKKPATVLDTLILDFQTAPDQASRVQAAKALLAYKLKAKRSWVALGISEADTREIQRLGKGDKPVPEVKPVPVKPAVSTPQVNKTRQAYNDWLKNPDRLSTSMLLNTKKAAKKGWPVLGFTEDEVKSILKAQKKFCL